MHRPHPAPAPALFGYDPVSYLPNDHLARLVEAVVELADIPRKLHQGRGQPAFDPRLCAKVLIYGYATGVRSSRQLERLCFESLPYLFLTRGDAPSYRTLCSFRVHNGDAIEAAWLQLFAAADEMGLKRMGRIVIDSSKFRANASPDSIVDARDYDVILEELKRILKEAQDADDKDDEDPPGETRTGHPVDTEQMRDILRRVRKRSNAPPQADRDKDAAQIVEPTSTTKSVSAYMLPRIEAAIETITAAQQQERKVACLTDPDARMMLEGREKHLQECHSFEVVVDRDCGLLVVGQSTQSSSDNPRLDPLITAAKSQEPDGIVCVDADSGYYTGDVIGRLITDGIDVCIPDGFTAGDLHRGQPIGTLRKQGRDTVVLTYDAEADVYRCPEGNQLRTKERMQHRGQDVAVYRAQRSCANCPLARDCLTQPGATRRTIKRGKYADILEAAKQRFEEREHQQRYHHRSEAVETVFAFLRATLGYTRWLLRGKERVACEARLFKIAYQMRKVHVRWSQQAA